MRLQPLDKGETQVQARLRAGVWDRSAGGLEKNLGGLCSWSPRSAATYLLRPPSEAWNLPPRPLTGLCWDSPQPCSSLPQSPICGRRRKSTSQVPPGSVPGGGRETPWTTHPQTQNTVPSPPSGSLRPGDLRPSGPRTSQKTKDQEKSLDARLTSRVMNTVSPLTGTG